jgi:CRISPR type IV-associated protein Csf3
MLIQSEYTKDQYLQDVKSEKPSNLEITMRMITPICLTVPFLHLDSILIHRLALVYYNREYNDLHSTQIIDLFEPEFPMPFTKTGVVFNTSSAIFSDEPTKIAKITTVYKRFEESHANKIIQQKGRRQFDKVELMHGHYKNYAMKLILIESPIVRFYSHGWRTAIQKLLGQLFCLGKKSAYGYGAILKIEVKEIQENWSIVKEGISMRTIPIEMLTEFSDAANMSYSVPYWDRSKFVLCAPPGTKIKLKEFQ